MSEPKKPRRLSHCCEVEIAREIRGFRLRPCCLALARGLGRTTTGRLIEEGAPHRLISVGPKGRRSVRFSLEEFDLWLSGRRGRQVAATLEGTRYSRRGAA